MQAGSYSLGAPVVTGGHCRCGFTKLATGSPSACSCSPPYNGLGVKKEMAFEGFASATDADYEKYDMSASVLFHSEFHHCSLLHKLGVGPCVRDSTLQYITTDRAIAIDVYRRKLHGKQADMKRLELQTLWSQRQWREKPAVGSITCDFAGWDLMRFMREFPVDLALYGQILLACYIKVAAMESVGIRHKDLSDRNVCIDGRRQRVRFAGIVFTVPTVQVIDCGFTESAYVDTPFVITDKLVELNEDPLPSVAEMPAAFWKLNCTAENVWGDAYHCMMHPHLHGRALVDFLQLLLFLWQSTSPVPHRRCACGGSRPCVFRPCFDQDGRKHQKTERLFHWAYAQGDNPEFCHGADTVRDVAAMCGVQPEAAAPKDDHGVIDYDEKIRVFRAQHKSPDMHTNKRARCDKAA